MKTRNMIQLMALIALMTVPASAQTNDRWGMFSRAEATTESRETNQWAFRLTSDCTFAEGRCLEKTFDFGGVYLREVENNLIFSGIYQLSADYRVMRGEGARYRVILDANGDGLPDGSLWIMFAPAGEGWQRSGNLINSAAASYDLSQFGGSKDGSYAEAVSLIGGMRVVSIALVADSGWKAPQEVLVDNVQINDQTMRARNFTRSPGRRVIQQ